MPIQGVHWSPLPSRPPSPAVNTGRRSRRVPPRGDCTMPVRTWATRTPDACCRAGRRLPIGDHVGQKAVPALAGLGQDLVAPIGAVDANCRRRDQAPGAAAGRGGPGDRLGQGGGGSDPAVADGLLVAGRKPAGNGRARPGGPRRRCLPGSPARGRRGRHWRSSGPVGTARTRRTTWWPPAPRKADRAVPTRPELPVMATRSGSGPNSRPQARAARSPASWRCR